MTAYYLNNILSDISIFLTREHKIIEYFLWNQTIYNLLSKNSMRMIHDRYQLAAKDQTSADQHLS